MTVHTPAPWIEVRHGYETLYTVHTFIEHAGIPIAGLWSPQIDEGQKANAHLIAAAPELLAVLKETYETGDSWEFGSELDSRIKAVIAKAEGR